LRLSQGCLGLRAESSKNNGKPLIGNPLQTRGAIGTWFPLSIFHNIRVAYQFNEKRVATSLKCRIGPPLPLLSVRFRLTLDSENIIVIFNDYVIKRMLCIE
jgi:hypothetical protein